MSLRTHRTGDLSGAPGTRIGLWFATLAALCAGPQPASARAQLPPSVVAQGAGPRSSGLVVQVTLARAFLDAGSQQGLHLGEVLELRRGAAAVGRCTVDRLAEHFASCTGTAARVGDRFALGPPPAAPKLVALPARKTAAELGRRKQALESAPLSAVGFTPSEAPRPQRGSRVFLRASQTIWVSGGASTWQGQRLDVRVLGAQLTDGTGALPATLLSLDLSAVHLSRPDVATFRPGSDAQLYVWEAALEARALERGATFACGRVLPWYAPGAARLDGAQLGYHLSPGLELGVFGGGIPDPATLEPTFSRATAGAYWALDHKGERSDFFPYASTTGRLAWVRAPELGTRLELESSSIAQLTSKGSLAADVRIGLGDAQGPGGLDAARLSFDLRPAEGLTLVGSFRYTGAALLEDTALAVASGPSHHADLAFSWEANRSLVFGLEGGLAQDDTAGGSFGRSWVGPTVALPRLFGSQQGLSAGVHLERGDLPGASAWAGATFLPWEHVHVMARATAAIDSRAEGRDVTLGIFGSARAQLFDHVALQCTLLARAQPVALGSLPPDLMGGLFADLGLRGDF